MCVYVYDVYKFIFTTFFCKLKIQFEQNIDGGVVGVCEGVRSVYVFFPVHYYFCCCLVYYNINQC